MHYGKDQDILTITWKSELLNNKNISEQKTYVLHKLSLNIIWTSGQVGAVFEYFLPIII